MNSKNLLQLPDTSESRIRPNLQWQEVDTIFLDMDGTLLDKYYDDYFWEHYLPEAYANKNYLSYEEARTLLLTTYRSVENTLQWTDLDYWTERLQLDIANLKAQIKHLVNVHPYVLEFLDFLEVLEKPVYLVTNAHPKALKMKMEEAKISKKFDRLICSQEVGAAKEQTEFWHRLQQILPYDKEKTLFVDDNEKVLASASDYGIAHLIHVAKSSTRLPPLHSMSFPSILSFHELLPT
jgi:5'-nucleotidase